MKKLPVESSEETAIASVELDVEEVHQLQQLGLRHVAVVLVDKRDHRH